MYQKRFREITIDIAQRTVKIITNANKSHLITAIDVLSCNVQNAANNTGCIGARKKNTTHTIITKFRKYDGITLLLRPPPAYPPISLYLHDDNDDVDLCW